MIFQVFVNFAKDQHGEEDSQAYDNPVDTSDELPLQSVRTSEEAVKMWHKQQYCIPEHRNVCTDIKWHFHKQSNALYLALITTTWTSRSLKILWLTLAASALCQTLVNNITCLWCKRTVALTLQLLHWLKNLHLLSTSLNDLSQTTICDHVYSFDRC